MRKVITPFSKLAGAFRARIVKTWLMKTEYSPAVAAGVLNETAVNNKYVRRASPVPGAALGEWGKSGVTPLWAAQASLTLLLDMGWTPGSEEEWAGFAAIYLQSHKSEEFESLISSLPENIDHQMAAGWLAAAIEEDLRFRQSKKTT